MRPSARNAQSSISKPRKGSRSRNIPTTDAAASTQPTNKKVVIRLPACASSEA
jgi:hypothetical protein